MRLYINKLFISPIYPYGIKNIFQKNMVIFIVKNDAKGVVLWL